VEAVVDQGIEPRLVRDALRPGERRLQLGRRGEQQRRGGLRDVAGDGDVQAGALLPWGYGLASLNQNEYSILPSKPPLYWPGRGIGIPFSPVVAKKARP
jgi:hypothetical protein